jgi:hypothetical protein
MKQIQRLKSSIYKAKIKVNTFDGDMYLTKVVLICLGATWSTSELFYMLSGAFDRNRIIPTFNGIGFIFPCYNSTVIPHSFILQLSSEMSIVSRTEIEQSDYLTQPTVIRLFNSSQLRAFFRDKRGQWIYCDFSSF